MEITVKMKITLNRSIISTIFEWQHNVESSNQSRRDTPRSPLVGSRVLPRRSPRSCRFFFRAIPFHQKPFLSLSIFPLFARVEGCRSVEGIWDFTVRLIYHPSFRPSPAAALRFLHFHFDFYTLSFF